MNYFFFIYHGYGWAVLLIVGGFCAAVEAIMESRGYLITQSDNFPFAIALICASVPCWLLGRYLLGYHATVKDKETGQKIKVPQPYHALFFIPMHWWAPILIAFGVWALVANASGPRPSASQTLPTYASTASAAPQPRRIQGGALPYSVVVPERWTVARNTDDFDIELSAERGNFAVGIYALNGALPDVDTDRWVTLLLSKFTGASEVPLARSHSAVIDDQQWQVLRGEMPISGFRVDCSLYAHAHDRRAYGIIVLTPKGSHSPYVTEAVRIAESFRFPTQ